MTSRETIDVVRMLLDDSVAWYVPMRELINCINKAQLISIGRYHTEGDERALRPLYVTDVNVVHNSFASRQILYPRTCRISIAPVAQPNDNDYISWSAEYIEPHLYSNIPIARIDTSTIMPRCAYWTYQNAIDPTDGLLKPQVMFSDSQPLNINPTVAMISYIALPTPFTFTNTPATDIPLSVPREYHLDIVALAAEYANDIDVGEYERGDVADARQGQKLTLSNSGELSSR